MLTHKAVILQGNEEQIKTRLTRQVIVLGAGVREGKPWYTYILPLSTRRKAS
jgi:hypothetical protein